MLVHRAGLIFLWILLVITAVYSQPIQQITVDDGLSQGFVSSVLSDKEGFLWIGTLDGLNRFDGHTFKVWRHVEREPLTLSGNSIFRSALDEKGNLWVISEGGLQIMDRKRGQFFTPPCLDTIQPTGMRGLALGKSNRCWILQGNNLLYLAADASASTAKELADRMNIRQINYPIQETGVLRCVEAGDTALFVGGENGLFTWSYRDEKLRRMPILLPQTKVFNIWWDAAAENLWVQFENQIYLLNAAGQRSFDIKRPAGKGDLRGTKIGDKSYLFSSTQIYQWDGHTFKTLPVQITQEIISATADRFGNLWIGTNARGLRKLQPEKKWIPKYLEGRSISNPMIADTAGNLWIMSKTGPDGVTGFLGYYRFSPEKGTLEEPLFGQRQLAMTTDQQAGYWFIDGQKKLHHLNKNRAQDRIVTLKTLPEKTNIRGILTRRNGRVVTLLTGWFFVEYDPETGKERRVSLLQPGNQKSVPTPNAWLEGSEGSLWIGTDLGLFYLAPDTAREKQGARFIHARSSPAALTNSRVCSILQDPGEDAVIWIGTQHGLNRFDTRNNQIRAFTQEDGLPDDVIYAMLPGQAQTIWLSTNRGLIEFNTENFDFRFYTTADGLPAGEFNTNVSARTVDGRLWFGSVNGLTGFHPRDMAHYPVQPEVLFTGVNSNWKTSSAAGFDGVLNLEIPYCSEIRLPHNNNTLQVSFALLDLTMPDEHIYRYRLNDEDNKWIALGRNNSVSFAGFEPGDYQLEVQGRNGQSGWSAPAKLNFFIIPPWWQTWWARVLMLILAFVLFFTLSYLWRRVLYWQRKYSNLTGPKKAQEVAGPVAGNPDDVFVSSIMEIIAQRYSDPAFGVAQIQKEMALSKSHLHRKLGALTGQSAGSLLRRYRLERAKSLLIERADISINQVAAESGFTDASYFARVFSQEYGNTPKAFQKKTFQDALSN